MAIRVGKRRPGVLDAVLAGLTQLPPQTGASSTGTGAFKRVELRCKGRRSYIRATRFSKAAWCEPSAAFLRRLAARIPALCSAASQTRTPILGWLGSMSTCTPLSSSVSLEMGPIEATITWMRAFRSSSSNCISTAIANRCGT